MHGVWRTHLASSDSWSHCDKHNQADNEHVDELPLEYGAVVGTPEASKASKGVISRSIEMMSNSPTRRAVFLGCGIMVIQQCCGINT